MLMLLAGVLLFFLQESDTGVPALLTGMVLAVMPLPLYLGIALWLDRYEPEPPALLFGAFAWGALVAVIFSFLVNTANALAPEGEPGPLEFARTFLSIPAVEELSKGLALFLLFFWRKEDFDGIIDGVVYACMISLGFAMTENVHFYGQAMEQGGAFELTVTFALRGILSPFAHPLYTSFTGIGLGLARQSDKPLVKLAAPLVGLVCAVGLHALWNYSASIDLSHWFLTYLTVMVPAGAVVLVILGFSARYESRIVKAGLEREVQEGRISPEDYEYLQSMRGRLHASAKALVNHGLAAWLACERFNNLASELAFVRHRARRGFTAALRAAQLDAAIRKRMREERAKF